MIPLSIAVAHTPEVYQRKVWLREQIDALGGMDTIRERVLRYRVCRDVLRGSPRERSMWKVTQRMWESIHPEATHALLLSDDMIPVRHGFYEAVEQIMAARPDHPVGLFCMRETQRTVLDRGEHWWSEQAGLWGGSILIPTWLLRDIHAWCVRCIPADYRWDDGRILMYTIKHGIESWFVAPSLMEHVGAADSTLGNGNRLRVAKVVMDDVRHIDFSVMPDRPIRLRGHRYKPDLERWGGCPEEDEA